MKKLALLPVAVIAAITFAAPANADAPVSSSQRVAVNASDAAKAFDASVLGMQPTKAKGPAKCGTLTLALDGIKKGTKDKGKSKGKNKGKTGAHYVGSIVHEGRGLTPYTNVTEPPAVAEDNINLP